MTISLEDFWLNNVISDASKCICRICLPLYFDVNNTNGAWRNFFVFFFQNCYQISFCKVHTVKTVKQLSTRYVICCMFACFDVYVYMYVQSSHVNKLLPHTDIVTACAGSSGGLVLFR